MPDNYMHAAEIPPEKIIKPILFKPRSSRPSPQLVSPKRLFICLLALLMLSLSSALWFVFAARQVAIRINPEPEKISIGGALLKVRLGSNYLLRPGRYLVKAEKPGYKKLELPLVVTGDANQQVSATMEKLPGRLTVSAFGQDQPSGTIAGAMVYLDGTMAGTTPLTVTEVKPGLRELSIKAESYQEFKAALEIEGMGVEQTINAPLVPGWAEITIDSLPTRAGVSINAVPRGETPLRLKLAEGEYQMEISAPHYKIWRSTLSVKAGQHQALETVKLPPADGTIRLETTPPGANVTADGTFFGQTPLSIPLAPDSDHTLHISKAGYRKTEHRVRVASQDFQVITLNLEPLTGIINFMVTPENAALFINGTSQGPVPRSLTLTAVPQQIRIVKDGYEPYRGEITPQPGFPQEVRINLEKIAAKGAAAAAALIKALNGYPLLLVRPSSFTMGSSRQEQGRRSNETIREIVLGRPFYMGLKEVTNGEFRKYLPGHDSGSVKNYSLNQDNQPVVNISWEQAALFCNWLSEKEKLPPAYIQQGGRIISPAPLPNGYRLPTEAEWEYCARFAADKKPLLYPWGTSFPPTARTVNIADLSAKGLLSSYFDNYEDGYPVSAPPASFAAGALGLYDLAGNVAEWCHDFYSIYTYNPGQRFQDPAGPQEGTHHLVRGSSWKHASISDVRSAFRDYSSEKRPDVGFRICRYAD